MRIISWLLFVIFAVCAEISSADSIIDDWIKENHITIIKTKDLDSYVTNDVKISNPGIVTGNFKGGKTLSAAILEKSNGKISLKIVSCEKPTQCIIEREEDISNYKGFVFLSVVQKGITLSTPEYSEEKREQNLVNDGIKVNYYGKGEVVYYWDSVKKAWDTIGISD